MTIQELVSKMDYWVTIMIVDDSQGYGKILWTGCVNDLPDQYLDRYISYIEPTNRARIIDKDGVTHVNQLAIVIVI